jgi:hypothetical protein
VHVGVVDPGHDRAARCIDHLGAAADAPAYVGVRTDLEDVAVAPDGDCRGTGVLAEPGEHTTAQDDGGRLTLPCHPGCGPGVRQADGGHPADRCGGGEKSTSGGGCRWRRHDGTVDD